MTSLPLHPAIVHLPLGLAFVIPALAVGFAWALWTGRIRQRASWIAILALQAVLLTAGLAAMNTGEREEDRVGRDRSGGSDRATRGICGAVCVGHRDSRSCQPAGPGVQKTSNGSKPWRPSLSREASLSPRQPSESATLEGNSSTSHNAGAAYAVAGQQVTKDAAPIAAEGRQHAA